MLTRCIIYFNPDVSTIYILYSLSGYNIRELSGTKNVEMCLIKNIKIITKIQDLQFYCTS